MLSEEDMITWWVAILGHINYEKNEKIGWLNKGHVYIPECVL